MPKQTQLGDIKLNTKEVALMLGVYEMDVLRAIRGKHPVKGVHLPDPIIQGKTYLFDYEAILPLVNGLDHKSSRESISTPKPGC